MSDYPVTCPLGSGLILTMINIISVARCLSNRESLFKIVNKSQSSWDLLREIFFLKFKRTGGLFAQRAAWIVMFYLLYSNGIKYAKDKHHCTGEEPVCHGK